MHEHYDAEGRLTGTTVVTRETAWDEETRARALALADYENSLCGCGCGLPVETAYDKTKAFKVDRLVCQAGRARQRVQREAYRQAESQQAAHPEGWDDGLYFIVNAVED